MKTTGKRSFSGIKVSARLQAIWWLSAVIKEGRSLNEVLAKSTASTLTASERAFAKQLVFGSLRYYHRLKTVLDQLMKKPLKQKDLDVYSILILGTYQLDYLSVPDHAALSESVELTRQIKKSWATGLVNGILRNYQKLQGKIKANENANDRLNTDKVSNTDRSILQHLSQSTAYQFSHPSWMVNQLQSDWPAHYQSILHANNQQAVMTIRVNQALVSVTHYREHLLNIDLHSSTHPLAEDALILASPRNVEQLPGFEQGLVSVQDAAAQLVVDLLDLTPGLSILDACAAPGGKTTHILQRQADTQLTSVEVSPNRIEKIKQNLQRLKIQSNNRHQLICADVLAVEDWWDGQLFDRILLDVPCSASGVIRRNPDIKLHRQKQDVEKLVQLQEQILTRCWPLLNPGGRLVYATCSVFKAENEQQIARFTQKIKAIPVVFGEEKHAQLLHKRAMGYQIFPADAQMDGFYFCALVKPR